MSTIRIAIDKRLQTDRISVRQAARDIGISHTTLNRVIQGEPPNVDTMTKIAQWLGISPAEFLEGPDEVDTTAAQIAILIRSEPRLQEIFVEAARRVSAGEMDQSVFEDLISYAAWKMGGAKGVNDR
jgi:transcriptional regulator with XRE-family HTH domain